MRGDSCREQDSQHLTFSRQSLDRKIWTEVRKLIDGCLLLFSVIEFTVDLLIRWTHFINFALTKCIMAESSAWNTKKLEKFCNDDRFNSKVTTALLRMFRICLRFMKRLSVMSEVAEALFIAPILECFLYFSLLKTNSAFSFLSNIYYGL